MSGNGRLAIETAEAALAMAWRSKKIDRLVEVLTNLGAYYIGCDRWSDARTVLNAALNFRDEQHPWIIWNLQHVAALNILEFLDRPMDHRFVSGLTLLGYVDADLKKRGVLRTSPDLHEYQRVSRALAHTFSPEDLAANFSVGAMMSWDRAVHLALLLICGDTRSTPPDGGLPVGSAHVSDLSDRGEYAGERV